MLTLVVGGSASGKSSFAESLMVSGDSERRIYLATMLLRDEECEKRALHHREMRRDKAFETLECPRALERANIPPRSSVLLEDLSNLAANEFFGDEDSAGAAGRIMSGILRLEQLSEALVIVSNELFLDGMEYDRETLDYLMCLSALNRAVAARADLVYEVICGIPILWKESAS
ncbi:MAG: cobalamin biosynthesis protein [Oscillospiraceae bacterium]|nr:cobalamin biosynthesis protein [Oscillospiraceae bacterium]